MKTLIAIQIVNFKTKRFLDPLLESIYKDIKGSKIDIEVNILDNASSDYLDDLEGKWHQHGVRVYYSNRNVGFGAGQNILATKTSAKYLLLLNPDLIIIEKDTIKRLLQTLEKNKAVVVGPRLLTPENKTNKDNLIQQQWDHSTSESLIVAYKPHDQITESVWVSGAVFLIKRHDFIDVGKFDERFFLYYEELDLCLRLRKLGAVIIYDPSINVLHYGSAVASKKSLYAKKSFLYYQLKKLIT